MLKNVYCKSYAFLLTTLIMALKIKCIIWLWKLLLDSKVIFVTPIPVPKDSQIMHWSKCLWHGTPDSKLNVSRFNRFPCLFLDKIRFLSHRPLFLFSFFTLSNEHSFGAVCGFSSRSFSFHLHTSVTLFQWNLYNFPLTQNIVTQPSHV